MNKKLTKQDIENLANEIISFLEKYNLQTDVCIYYNNKRISFDARRDIVHYENNISPLDYFEYVNHKHILSMSFDGEFYDSVNYSGYKMKEFCNILKKYNLYYELGDSWNLSVYPIYDDMEIEYVNYEEKPKPIHIYSFSTEKDAPPELVQLKLLWDMLSKTMAFMGGSIVTGDGFSFIYKGKEYFMTSPNIQGSLAYEYWIDQIKSILEKAGATNIYYNYGRMD